MHLQASALLLDDETISGQAVIDRQTLQAALRAEAIRILKRKRNTGDRKKLSEKVLNELSGYIRDPALPVEQLANELIIAHLFAEATAQAGIKPEELPGAPPQNGPEETE
jgi:hypothetical protein